ncbi:hypothetical protein [Deinococcus hohokamensis]|uniref:Uncharacterized protein n=1 Tax=Deinococcus hohokamensis TaxID=309883 RepID=A0ABV9I929_9DEIO
MRNFKSIAMIAVLALSNVSFAAQDGATLTVNNTSSDTVTAGNATLNWNLETTAAGTGSLEWTTPASNSGNRKISAQLQEQLPDFITSLTAEVKNITPGTGTGAPAVTLGLQGVDVVTSIPAFQVATSQVDYVASIAPSARQGFNSGTQIVVNYTISSAN